MISGPVLKGTKMSMGQIFVWFFYPCVCLCLQQMFALILNLVIFSNTSPNTRFWSNKKKIHHISRWSLYLRNPRLCCWFWFTLNNKQNPISLFVYTNCSKNRQSLTAYNNNEPNYIINYIILLTLLMSNFNRSFPESCNFEVKVYTVFGTGGCWPI